MFALSFMLIAPMIFASVISAADIESSSVQSNNLKCETDRDCPELEHCFENKICSPCFSCEEAHRHQSRIRCPRKAKDCGPCLPGYVKESFSVPNKRTVCIEVVTVAQPQLAAEDSDEIVLNPIWIIGITVIGVLVLMAFASWHCYKKRTIAVVADSWQEMGIHPRPQSGDGTSLPPPSYEDCQRSDNGSVAYSFQLRVTERPESKTTAIPFQMPFGDRILHLDNPESRF
ncbi:uncharacterized protein LOC135844102 isoform X2 [Planococcus citri]|uniref:uncharacterized protein LOC135844102 isoform X2 n=1 Tax=Planococcus citri TaxID=170843 RepID=UPI0031F8F4EA